VETADFELHIPPHAEWIFRESALRRQRQLERQRAEFRRPD
jgi:hypothetical protein